MINYARFCKKVVPKAVLWHRQQWADNVTSQYYGRYGEKKGAKKDLYYLQIGETVYSLYTVEDLINLDHDLYLQRLTLNDGKESGALITDGLNYCSICAHKEGCPFLAFAYHVRKKACLFIPVFHLVPTSQMEMKHIRPAENRLITDVLMNSLYSDRGPDHHAFEKCAPISVYKHTFTFSQLQ